MRRSIADPRTVVVEFNELVPRLMSQFIDDGALPNFKRFRDLALTFITDAEESDEHLNPWIQWVTVHCGQSAREHDIFSLADGQDLKAPCLWNVAAENGLRSWICGSMNTKIGAPMSGEFLPDPWAESHQPVSDELRIFNDFVRTNVQEHTTGGRQKLSTSAHFLWFMLNRGLSTKSVMRIVRQLAAEKLNRYPRKWKRVSILDRLQLDLFKSRFKSQKPALSTFFSNSTAHLQHQFWRNMEPELFSVKPDSDDPELARAILWGYMQMDKMLGEIVDLAGPHATIIFCTALSQQPFLTHEGTGGKRAYRLRYLGQFLDALDLTDKCTTNPLMAEEVKLCFPDSDCAEVGGLILSKLWVGEKRAISWVARGRDISFTCNIRTSIPAGTMITSTDGIYQAPFHDTFYELDTMKSGGHHPSGLCWIKTPEGLGRNFDNTVSLTRVAPTVLASLNLPAPYTMNAEPLPLSANASEFE